MSLFCRLQNDGETFHCRNWRFIYLDWANQKGDRNNVFGELEKIISAISDKNTHQDPLIVHCSY